MPSLSRSLEQALHHAIKLASDRHHEYATLEHLLMALMDDADAGQHFGEVRQLHQRDEDAEHEHLDHAPGMREMHHADEGDEAHWPAA